MTSRTRPLAFIARFAVIGLALAFVVGTLWPDSGSWLRRHLGLQPAAPASSSAPAMPRAVPADHAAAPAPASYASAVRRAAPSVVSIYANKVVTEQPVRMFSDPVLQRWFGNVPAGPAYKRREQSLGSGVIMNGNGYVLTNNHVIAGAQDIQILLYDGRVAEAKVVGSDAETDLAVLHIDAKNLPAIPLSDTTPQVGDVVLAIGNPFGIGQTVTMGIVSAIGRQLNASSSEEFIQTDAAINFGNSGGALVNTQGDLVGINTALLGRTLSNGRASGAEGISFAIPVATAKMVLDQIITHGYVVRGWIGADFGRVPVAADSGLPAAARGVIVTDVYPGSPAAKAGLKAGDVLLQMAGKDITDPSDLRRREAATKPGTKVTLSGLRNGAPLHITVTLAQRPPLASLSH
jgi:serine protease DegQ